jgi:tripartite-type tricarboxylate transporter receptor subunit TctC
MGHSRRNILAALLMSAIASAWPAQAQDAPPAFPRKPMTLVVPLSAGGPVDILGRLLAQEYQTRTGQSATVENKTGGAGNIGIDMVRKSTPDGTTLLVIPAGNLTINPTLLKNLSFQVERDFAPITMLATAPNIILASRQLGVSTVAELIAKAKQGKVTYGTPGVGSQLHLLMELLRVKTGGEFVHVPYRGSAPALNDLIGGHIDLVSTNVTAALGAIQAGTIVPLAMTTAQRSSLVPNVTTLMEAGVPDIDVTSWYGLLSPSAVPADVREAIFTVTRDVLNTPAVQSKLQAQGLSTQIEEPAKFAERIRRETALWADLIKSRNITAE